MVRSKFRVEIEERWGLEFVRLKSKVKLKSNNGMLLQLVNGLSCKSCN